MLPVGFHMCNIKDTLQTGIRTAMTEKPREWFRQKLESTLPGYGDKIEKLVYNSTITRISKYNASPKVEEFRVIYNWLTQVVIEDEEFLRDVIEERSIPPSDTVKVLVGRLDSKDNHLSKIVPEDDERIATRYHVSRLLCDHLGDSLGSSVEKSIAKHQTLKSKYKNQSLKLLSNIKNTKTNLKDRLLNGTFDPKDMGNATHKNLWPELWKRPEMQPGHRAIITRHKDDQVKDSLIKCGNCKNNTVQTREFQTRSGDEPMTVFCNCTTCGKRWKM